MNVKIGEKIKALRKRDDMTQERLAEALGVTNQAVSKWESGSSYPDIEYISPIANIFNVTIDYLFDHDTAEKKRKIQDYVTQFYTSQLDNRTQCDEQINLMRQALAEFPAEEKLLLNLAQALFWQWINNGGHSEIQNGNEFRFPDVEKNKSIGYWEESMKISEELLDSSTDDHIRGECRSMLASIYGAIGEKDKLLAIAKKCGSIHHSMEGMLSENSWGEDGIRYKQEFLSALLTPLQNTLRALAKRAGAEAEEEAFAILFRLHDLIFRDDCGQHNHWLRFLYGAYAGFLFGNNKSSDEVLDALEQAFVHAKKYAEFADGKDKKPNNSPFTDLTKPYRENIEPQREVWGLLHWLERNPGIIRSLNANPRFAALIKEADAWVAERA